MPGGHDDAEQRSGRAGMGRKRGKRCGAGMGGEGGRKGENGGKGGMQKRREWGEKEDSGAERRSLAQTAGRVRELVSSGVLERGAVEQRRRERDVVHGYLT